mmetsp:Transcript_13518/g.37969  ORF Transcript_13518/g.37969 Transcript_13518/m.37969 type:complete len:312 (-) Transcript_13518:64-999(-)
MVAPLESKCISSLSSCFSSFLMFSMSTSWRTLPFRPLARTGFLLFLWLCRGVASWWCLRTRSKYWSETRVLSFSGYSISKQNSLSCPLSLSSSTEWSCVEMTIPSTLTLMARLNVRWKTSLTWMTSSLPPTSARKMPLFPDVLHSTASPAMVWSTIPWRGEQSSLIWRGDLSSSSLLRRESVSWSTSSRTWWTASMSASEAGASPPSSSWLRDRKNFLPLAMHRIDFLRASKSREDSNMNFSPTLHGSALALLPPSGHCAGSWSTPSPEAAFLLRVLMTSRHSPISTEPSKPLLEATLASTSEPASSPSFW